MIFDILNVLIRKQKDGYYVANVVQNTAAGEVKGSNLVNGVFPQSKEHTESVVLSRLTE